MAIIGTDIITTSIREEFTLYDVIEHSLRLLWAIRGGEVTTSAVYTRADVGYSINAFGAIVTNAQDSPAFEYIDGGRRFLQYGGTNLLKYSQDFTNAVWQKQQNVVLTPSVGRVGGFTATLYSLLAATSRVVYQDVTTNPANKTYTFTVWLRAIVDTRVYFTARRDSVIVGNLGIHDLLISDGWKKFAFTHTFDSTSGSNFSFYWYDISGGVGDRYYIDEPQVVELPYAIPYIPTEATTKTVNKGTIQGLAEDIDTRAFKFSGSDFVNADLLTQELGRVKFKMRASYYYNSGAPICLTQCPKDINYAINMVNYDNSLAYIRWSHDGMLYKALLTYDTDHTVELRNDGTFLLDGVVPEITSTPISLALATTDILFGYSGVGHYYQGYAWDIEYYSKATGELLVHYKEPGNRVDDVAPDSSGNSLHGKIVSTNLAGVRAENTGFGYPVNETAPRPFVSSVGTRYGVKGALTGVDGGNASSSLVLEKHKVAEVGSNLVRNGTFDSATGWTPGTGWSIADGVASCDGSQTANTSLRQDSALNAPLGKTYMGRVTVSGYTAGNIRIVVGGYDPGTYITANGIWTTNPITVINPLANENIYLTANADFIGSVDDVDIREVNAFLKTADGTPIIYIDPFDGYLKMTDGTNTCQSPSAVTPGVEYSAKFILDSTTMWIEKDGVAGTPTAFTGHMPDLGNRVFFLDSEIYQTVKDMYFTTITEET